MMYQIMQPVDCSIIVIFQAFANCSVGHLDFLSCRFGVFVHRARALGKLCRLVFVVMP
jgi:hypothetical protein